MRLDKRFRKILNKKVGLVPLSVVLLSSVAFLLFAIFLVAHFTTMSSSTEPCLADTCIEECIDGPDQALDKSSDGEAVNTNDTEESIQNIASEPQTTNVKSDEKSIDTITTTEAEELKTPEINSQASDSNAEEPQDQTAQFVPVESIRIKEYPIQRNIPMYGDDEADIELIVRPENATYDANEIKWRVRTQDTDDEKCARIINGKVHITAKYCTVSPFVIADLQGQHDQRVIPIEQTLIVTQTFKNTNTPCDNIKQNSTCFYETGDRVGFITNLDSVIWTITDEYRGGVVPEFSVYARYSGTADGTSGSISKVQVKSMHSPQSLTFYIKIK